MPGCYSLMNWVWLSFLKQEACTDGERERERKEKRRSKFTLLFSFLQKPFQMVQYTYIIHIIFTCTCISKYSVLIK